MPSRYAKVLNFVVNCSERCLKCVPFLQEKFYQLISDDEVFTVLLQGQEEARFKAWLDIQEEDPPRSNRNKALINAFPVLKEIRSRLVPDVVSCSYLVKLLSEVNPQRGRVHKQTKVLCVFPSSGFCMRRRKKRRRDWFRT